MAATPPVSRDVLNRETNARFWASTGFRPGQKLDPNNPTDKAMMPVWMDIFRKVKAEADSGTLVTTYDHPAVSQGLSDATVANKVTAMHVEAAARSTDPRDVQANAAAAATAAQVVAQRLRDAVARQPPTASPALVQDAADEAARTPPPPHAPAGDQIAHAQIQAAPSATAPDRRLIDATNDRFWQTTNYKPGQKLDMSIAEDRKMAKVWMKIFHELQREASAGGFAVPGPEQLSQPMTPPSGPPVTYGPPHVMPPSMGPPPGPSQMQFPMPFPTSPRPPTWPGPRPPTGPSMGPRPPMRPPMGPSMGPRPPMGPSQPMAPEAAPGAPPSGAPDIAPPDIPSDVPPDVAAPPSKGPSLLKYVAIGATVIAGGGLLYYVGTRKPSRSRSSRSSARIHTPSFAPSSFASSSARAARP
jgi:hypothetical protein